MEFLRDTYLKKLIKRKNNHLIKIITGVRRCGKSYLLFSIFYRYLLNNGIKEDHIIRIALDDYANRKLRDPDTIFDYVNSKIVDDDLYYLLLDEVQYLRSFEDVLNGFIHIANLDVYVTGSNAKFLSKDIITEFRGRGDQIHIMPLSFREFSSSYTDMNMAYEDYSRYGGLPLVASFKDDEDKIEYLGNILNEIYINDVIYRYRIRNKEDLSDLFNFAASSIGSLTNPRKLALTFNSVKKRNITQSTVIKYLNYLEDSFLIEKAKRYDIKGKRYINSPFKYYFTDLGLRNISIDFRQLEDTHIMENIIYNELRFRGYNVDVGEMPLLTSSSNGNPMYKKAEVDFVCNKGPERVYIQSAYRLPTPDKIDQEVRPLMHINDSFKKLIITRDEIKPRIDERGIRTINLIDFLLNKEEL